MKEIYIPGTCQFQLGAENCHWAKFEYEGGVPADPAQDQSGYTSYHPREGESDDDHRKDLGLPHRGTITAQRVPLHPWYQQSQQDGWGVDPAVFASYEQDGMAHAIDPFSALDEGYSPDLVGGVQYVKRMALGKDSLLNLNQVTWAQMHPARQAAVFPTCSNADKVKSGQSSIVMLDSIMDAGKKLKMKEVTQVNMVSVFMKH